MILDGFRFNIHRFIIDVTKNRIEIKPRQHVTVAGKVKGVVKMSPFDKFKAFSAIIKAIVPLLNANKFDTSRRFFNVFSNCCKN